MVPLEYDGKWGEHSEGWPEFTIPAELVEKLDLTKTPYPCMAALKQVLERSFVPVPYGCYVMVEAWTKDTYGPYGGLQTRIYGDALVRVETEQMRVSCLAAIDELLGRQKTVTAPSSETINTEILANRDERMNDA